MKPAEMNPIYAQELAQREAEKIKSSIAMSVFLVSSTMLFATLVLAFAVFRLSSEYWPPMGMERPSLFYPLVSTFFIIASSFTFEFYSTSLKRGDRELARLHYILTLIFGVGFLGAQVYLWSSLKNQGYLVDTGVFASMLHSFTWVHAVHILMGLAWLLYLLPSVREGATYERYEIRIINAGKFWHFLDIVWVLLFVVLFVL